MRLAILICAALIAPLARAESQQELRVEITDALGVPVPYAMVESSVSSRRVADSVGVVLLRGTATDSVRLVVRRIGYAPFEDWLPVRSVLHVRLTPLAPQLQAMSITARQNTVLAQQGFYDRVDRAERGAVVAEFLTPEDLAQRGAMTLERLFAGSRYVRSQRFGGRQTVLLGRSDCGYTVVVDGIRVETLQETRRGNTSINPVGTLRLEEGQGRLPPSIDELVQATDIAAVEVYPSAANAPSEIQAKAMGGRGSCGIIAIWTGGR